MKTIVFNTFLALLALLTGCRPSAASADLNRADCVMESNADSALVILLSIDTAVLASEADRALYDLLLTQAEDKCNMPITHSSGIASAIEYFSNHGPKRNLMRAYFYDAVAMYNASDYQKSMHDALSSYDIAEELNDTYWQAKTSELISFIFSKNFNSYGALPYTKKAVDLYEKSGKHRNHLFALVDYAMNLGSTHNLQRSKEILDSVYDITQNRLGDTTLMVYSLRAQLSNAYYLRDYQRLFNLHEKYKDFEPRYPLPSFDYFALSRAYITNGYLEEAKFTVKKVVEKYSNRGDSVVLLQAEAYLAEANRDYENTYLKFKEILNFNYIETKKILEQSIASTQRDYYVSKAKKEKDNNHRIKATLIIGACVFLIIIFLCAIIVSIRFRYKNEEIKRKVAEVWALSSEMCMKDEENSSLSKQIEEQQINIKNLKILVDSQYRKDDTRSISQNQLISSLFQSRWNTINMLCNEFYDTPDSSKANSGTYKKIKQELEKINKEDEFEKIELALNNMFDNIVTKLKSECNFLKDSDIRFITLVFAGASYRSICIMLDIARITFYQKRLRLIDRIQRSDAPNKQLFIDHMKINK